MYLYNFVAMSIWFSVLVILRAFCALPNTTKGDFSPYILR